MRLQVRCKGEVATHGLGVQKIPVDRPKLERKWGIDGSERFSEIASIATGSCRPIASPCQQVDRMDSRWNEIVQGQLTGYWTSLVSACK
jgi:hypothetical protein